jgi:WD40 repeat protein
LTTSVKTEEPAMLAVGTSNGQVKLLDPSDGKVRFDVVGHQVHIVCSVAISPDGKQIATSGDGHFTKVWDATDGTERLQLRGHDGSSGCRCVVQTVDKYPFLDRVVIEGCPVVAHSARVTAIAWSPCGRRIATGGSDKSVIFWDSTSGVGLYSSAVHTERITSLSFSSDGARLASSSYDRSVLVSSTKTGTAERRLQGHQMSVHACAWSRDCRTLASAGCDGAVAPSTPHIDPESPP